VVVFAELGFFGMFFWMGLLYYAVKGLLPRRGGDPPLAVDRARVPILASIVAVLVCSIFLSRQYVLIPYTIIGLGASYVSIAQRGGANIDMRFSRRDFRAIVALIVGSIVATWLWVILFVYRP
jgi:hypothetical protein